LLADELGADSVGINHFRLACLLISISVLVSSKFNGIKSMQKDLVMNKKIQNQYIVFPGNGVKI